MKKISFFAMLIAYLVVMTCCSKDDPLTELENYSGSSWNNGGSSTGSGTGGNGSSAITGELTTFDISLDAMTA